MSGPQRGDTGAPQAAQWGPVTGSPVPSWAVGSIPGAPAADVPTGYPPTGDGPTGYGAVTGPVAPAATGPGPARTGRSTRWGVARVLAVAVIALGLVNFIWGFLPELSLPRSTTTQGSLSVFSIGPAYVPILLLTAGLLAMTAFLPGEERSRFAVAAVSAGGAIGAIVSLGTQDAVSGFGQVSKGMGAILLVIFGIIQAVVALTAFVIGSGFVATPCAAGQSLREPGPGDQVRTGAGPTAFREARPPTAQPYPGQPYPGQGWPAPAGPWGAAADPPSEHPTGWGPAGYGPAPSPSAYPAGPVGGAPWEPSRSSIPPSADARSADTDPHGILVVDPAGPPPAAEPDVALPAAPAPEPPTSPSESAAGVSPTDRSVPGPGQPGDDRRPWDASADQDPSTGS